LDVMPGDEHLKVKTKVYAQIGSLFLYQRLYEKAMDSFLNSYQCDSILKDTIGIIYNLRDLALCYANTNRNEIGIVHLKKAINYANSIKNERMGRIAGSQLASLYLQRGEYEQAYDAIKPSLAHLDSTNISSVYSIAASVHQHLGHRDSSTYYYNKLLVYGDSYAKADAYYQLAKMSINDKQNSEIVSLLENYYNQANTRKSLAATESLAKMSALYDYQVHEREKIEAQHRADTFRLYSLIGVAVLFIITLIFIAYGQYYKRKELKTKVRMNLLAAMHEEEHRRSQAYIQENEKKIVELTKAISCLEENDTQRIEQLENAVQQLDLENQAAKAKIEKHEKAVKAIEISSLRISLINKADKGQILRKEDIKDIETLLNTNFPHFIDRIRNIDGINETDYRVTLLQKMKLMPKHICVLLCKESGTVSNVRKRLYKKVFKVMGTPKDWDDFVDLL